MMTINRFGWLPPPRDGRDQAYRLRALRSQLPAGTRRTLPYKDGPLLDQGQTPQCVGYAARGFLDGAPIMTAATVGPTAPELYRLAQDRDEWPGTNYDGTSVRGVCKALQDVGLIESYGWSQTTDEAVHWLTFNFGTLLAGTNWYAEMSDVDHQGFVREPAPSLTTPIGGHAYRLVWFVSKPDPTASYFVMRNSWGDHFGWPSGGARATHLSGYAKLSVRLFERLQREEGELAAPTQIRLKPVPA